MKIYIAEWEKADWVYIQVGDRKPVKVANYATLRKSPEYVLIRLQEEINLEYAAAIAEMFRNSLNVDITE